MGVQNAGFQHIELRIKPRLVFKERVKNKLLTLVPNEVIPLRAISIKSDELLNLVFESIIDRSLGFISFQVDFGDDLKPGFSCCRVGQFFDKLDISKRNT